MVRIFQVGAGSGGIHVLDSLARDERITHVTLIDHDWYLPHNVTRHPFSAPAKTDQLKVQMAADCRHERRPALLIEPLPLNLCDTEHQRKIEQFVADSATRVCAVDNETAKYHYDALFRHAGKPWTLGE